MAAIIGIVAALNDFLESDEDDDVEDIFAFAGSIVMLNLLLLFTSFSVKFNVINHINLSI